MYIIEDSFVYQVEKTERFEVKAGIGPEKRLKLISEDETVKNYEDYLPTYFPIVHPSPRNIIWQIKNPWFEAKVVPALRAEVKKILDEK